MIENINQGLGFITDKLDKRDYILEEKLYGSSALSEEVVFEEIDLCLDECMPDIYESQGNTNSCVAYSWTPNMELQVSRIFKKKYNTNGLRFNNMLSKKFLYYTTRYITDTDSVNLDCGLSFRYTAKELMGNGICTQTMYGDLLPINEKPSYDALCQANEYRINCYYTINSLQGILASLKLGLPIQVGVDIYGFDDARQTGYSAKSELWDSTTPLRANHGMLIVGTTFRNGVWMFKIRNSYGKNWGLNGHCYINAQKMWDFNIEQAMVFVVKELTSDLDVENKDYSIVGEIPNGSILIGKYGFNLDYANDNKNVEEIRGKIVITNGNIYVKSVTGEMFNNVTGDIVTLDKVVSNIGNKIIYKDKSGNESNINIK